VTGFHWDGCGDEAHTCTGTLRGMKKTQASITLTESLDGFTVSFPRFAPGKVVTALFSYLTAVYEPGEPVALNTTAGSLGTGWEADAGILPAGTTFTLTDERTRSRTGSRPSARSRNSWPWRTQDASSITGGAKDDLAIHTTTKRAWSNLSS
jgi:hypothetical protein